MRKVSTATALAAVIVAAFVGIYQSRTNRHAGAGAAVAAITVVPNVMSRDANTLASENWDAF